MDQPKYSRPRGHSPSPRVLIWTALLLALTAAPLRPATPAGTDTAVSGRGASGRSAQNASQQPQILCDDYFTCVSGSCPSGGDYMGGTCGGEDWFWNCCNQGCYTSCSGMCSGTDVCGGSASCLCFNKCEGKFQEIVYYCED